MPTQIYSENHISAPKGCCAPNFLDALDNDQVLLAQPPAGWKFPLQFCLKGVENWLKVQRISRKNFEAMRSSLAKLFHVSRYLQGVITRIQLLGRHRTLKI